MGSSLLRDVEHEGARVAVSIAGTAGDSAMPNHIDARLLQEGESFRRLTGNGEEEYRTNLTTRYIVRSPLRRRVLGGGFLMSTIIGFDCRGTIPPFMVPGRNMDGTFGSLVHDFLDPYAVGYVPYVFRHVPAETRDGADIHDVVGPSKRRLNDILITVIKAHRDTRVGSDVGDAAREVGRYLKDISGMSPGEFNEFIRERMLERTASKIRGAEQRLADEDEAPAYWARHLRALVENYEEHLTEKFFFAPIDLRGDARQRMATTRQLFRKYGRLLMQWPAMVEGAKELRAAGERGSQPV